jgi:hypothetical protein
MSGAVVYGFVDYSKVSTDRKFRDMYEETSTHHALATDLLDKGNQMVQKGSASILVEAPILIEKVNPKVKSKKKSKKKKEVGMKEFSRAALVD